MSVLIRGMEMPKSCASCRFNGAYCYAKGDEDAHSTLSCPLVPVPAHGRLIDADALISRCKDEKDSYYGHESAIIGEAVESAPTVIEAED